MFTGLVEAVGTIRDVRRTGAVVRISVACPRIAPELVYGQSVAVSGACLTVVELRGDVFDVEMMPETASRTRFASLGRGSSVNLERALRLGDRLDGHMVLGHVDGTAALTGMSGSPQTKKGWFRTAPDVMRYVVAKGSIAIDGVSLTVIDANRDSFSVGMIPATLEGTTLGSLGNGDVVNIETDIIGKYVERLTGAASSGGISLEELGNLGY